MHELFLAIQHLKNGDRSDALPHLWSVLKHQCLYLTIPDGPAWLYQLEFNITPPYDLPPKASVTMYKVRNGYIQRMWTSISYKMTIISVHYEGLLTWLCCITEEQNNVDRLPGVCLTMLSFVYTSPWIQVENTFENLLVCVWSGRSCRICTSSHWRLVNKNQKGYQDGAHLIGK